MKYSVLIEETISEKFAVEADSEEQAREIATDKYKKCEFVLEPGNVTQRKMCVVSEDASENVDWTEF